MLGRFAIAAALLAAAQPAAAQTRALYDDDVARALASIQAEHLRAHIGFLADDMLEGRAPGSRGGDLAAHYIATRFQRLGLSPAGAEDYLQPVPLARWRPVQDSTTASIGGFGPHARLRYPDDVVLWTESTSGSAAADAPLVFAGYGIVAPEYDWNDYAGTDVRGKAVLVLIGEPEPTPARPHLFGGSDMSGYARWTYKIEEAGRQGAAAVLLFHTTASAGYGWNVVRASWTQERFTLRNTPESGPPVLAWVRGEMLRPLIARAGRDPGNLEMLATRPDFRAHDIGLRFRASIAGTRTDVESPNVVGLLPGTHPTRAAQAVVFTAHYDHLGIGPAFDGDSIYNGAYDNASGVAALLEIAEAFTQLDAPPERTLVFIATTAEEAGLLGAIHYTRHPPPGLLTVATVNIDGLNLWGETHDAVALGANRSTLGTIVQRRAEQLGMYLAPDPAAETGLQFRTDQAAFDREGVPALGLMHGTSFRGRPPGYGDLFLARWQASNYHRPSDEFDPAADLRGALQQTRLGFLIGLDAATGPRPAMNEAR